MYSDCLELLKTTYQNDSNCILIFDHTQTLVWTNGKPSPFAGIQNLPALFHFPEQALPPSGDDSVCVGNVMYDYHCINVQDTFLILSCNDTPSLDKMIRANEDRNHLENFLAKIRQETFGITNAVSALNELVEEADDMLPQNTLYQCLNIIMGNCSRMMKRQYVLRELLQYYEVQQDAHIEPIDCASLLEAFATQSSRVLGKKVLLHAEPEMAVAVPPQRFEFCLLCMLVILIGTDAIEKQLRIHAQPIGDNAAITMTAYFVGKDTYQPPQLSSFIPLHETTQWEEEYAIIRHFCKAYQATLLESGQADGRSFCLRIPISDISPSHSLHTIDTEKLSHTLISPYHAMLSEISDYRYY
jgi:hypothetical protein